MILEKELLAMIGSDEHPNIRDLAEGGSYSAYLRGIGTAMAPAAGGDGFVFFRDLFVGGSGRGGSAGMEGPFGS